MLRSLQRLALVLALAGCSGKHASDSHASTAADAGTAGAHAGSTGSSNAGHGGPLQCTHGVDPSGEFYVACPDGGSITTGVGDGSDRDASVSGQLDASAGSDASTPAADSGSPAPPVEGPCGTQPPSCAFSYLRAKLDGSQCSLLADTLSVSFQSCEICGQAGNRVDSAIDVTDCSGNCGAPYSWGDSNVHAHAANACETRQLSRSLTGTTAPQGCIDVYASLSTAGDDLQTDATDRVRVCRCDRGTGQCKLCQNGACD